MPATGPAPTAPTRSASVLGILFPLLLGLWLGVALIKFGNPVIFEGEFSPPANFTEWLAFTWPAKWGGWMLLVVACFAAPFFRFRTRAPWWPIALLFAWLLWQFLAASRSRDPEMSSWVVAHFVVCVASFCVGHFALSRAPGRRWIWLGVGLGLITILWTGFGQRFGGLQATREFYEAYLAGTLPPEVQATLEGPELRRKIESPMFLQRVRSDRVYSTLFYANTFAAVLLLVTPAVLGAAWRATAGAREITRGLLVVLLGAGAAACLVWSGSKSGWLIALGIGGLALQQKLNVSLRAKLVVLAAIGALGVSALVALNLDYFQRGATSVSARGDYWRAGVDAALERPLFGHGPGTFALTYGERKAPESEMARLAHNDYLQQAPDSGIPGALLFGAFIIGSITWICRRSVRGDFLGESGLVWLGLLAWAMHSLVEFNLYVPALAWTAFLLIGWQLNGSERVEGPLS